MASFFFKCSAAPRDLPSFPTRRSPDLSISPGTARSAGQTSTAVPWAARSSAARRAEEHTSELQSLAYLVWRPFFLNVPPPPEIYLLSLHDALPISRYRPEPRGRPAKRPQPSRGRRGAPRPERPAAPVFGRRGRDPSPLPPIAG